MVRRRQIKEQFWSKIGKDAFNLYTPLSYDLRNEMEKQGHAPARVLELTLLNALRGTL